MLNLKKRQDKLNQFVVTSAQMRGIEERIFASGMPVSALMEKVAGRISQRIKVILESESFRQLQIRLNQNITSNNSLKIGILVGPGHNGGDGLVVARELFFSGYNIMIYSPFPKQKELTASHCQYVASLGIPIVDEIEPLKTCDVLIDAIFGFGLERAVTDSLGVAFEKINQWQKPILSIDLPSGLHTDTGEVLGTAIQATRTFCLGLWKQAFLQDQALDYLGEVELIDFDIPLSDIEAILGQFPNIQRLTANSAWEALPIPRPPATHKYKNGHLLIIAGSKRYTGAAILTGLGARATGVGMLSIAVPESIKPLLSLQLPEALIIGCPETEDGAILQLSEQIDLSQYDAIAYGPGLSQSSADLLSQIIPGDRPLILDADGLNLLATINPITTLSQRQAPTILTPHPGEFRRLFPELATPEQNRILAAQKAAQQTHAIVVLKGARTCIATADTVWINPDSTPALARGGSGDVLTGLIGGLLAPTLLEQKSLESAVKTAVWWHAQAGIQAAKERTELGVDAWTLTQYLIPTLKHKR